MIAPAKEARFYYSPYLRQWRPLTGGIECLSPRELEIVVMLARGKSVKEIAKEFGVSTKTIGTHRYRAMTKLGTHNVVILSHFLVARGVMRNLYADEPNG
jgi:two-component system, NarL family, invasion response regulator UvrY